MEHERHLGLFGATTLGVGAIVGGGILALAGVASPPQLMGWRTPAGFSCRWEAAATTAICAHV